MFGHYYCQICKTTHQEWERMNELLFCQRCKDWKSTRRFDVSEPSKGTFVNYDTTLYYDLPNEIKDDAHSVHKDGVNMMDWRNIGLKKETIKWINEAIINREHYIRFVIMEFYAGRDTFPEDFGW